MQSDAETRIRDAIDPFLYKVLTTKRFEQLVDSLMRTLGFRNTLKKPKRFCVVAVPNKDGEIVAKKVKPQPVGHVPDNKVEGVTIAKPTSDRPHGR